jgi:DNA polymerase-3 subunit gamma/tau
MKNLYKRYEPLNFKDIMGQENIVKELLTRSKNDNFSQVMFFTGNTGTGKTSLEKIVAKSILCDTKVDGEPCNTCTSCQNVILDKNSEHYEVYDASKIGKDAMQGIIESAHKISPFSKKKLKVIVIDELQEIKSSSAEKSLLKALESPRDNIFWLVSSMDNTKLNLATIDRCTPYYFRNLKEEKISERLFEICEKENIEMNEEKINILFALSNHSHGIF